MATYVMFGTYSPEAMKAISAERTDRALAVIKKYDGQLKCGYALLGELDLVLVLELPDNECAIQTSAALSRLLNIRFHAAPAISIADFDRLVG